MMNNKKKAIFKNEEGSGLVLALMVLLVLSILGASLGVLTIGSLQLSDINRDSNSAYYIAEAGANMAYEEFTEIVRDASSTESDFHTKINEGIKKENSKEESFDPRGVKKIYRQFKDNQTATVSITSKSLTDTGNQIKYIINSIGEIDGKKRVVEKKVLIQWTDENPAGQSLVFLDKATLVIDNSLIIDKSGGSKHDIISNDVYVYNMPNNSYNNYGQQVAGTIKKLNDFKIYKDYVASLAEYSKNMKKDSATQEYKKNNQNILQGNYKINELKFEKNRLMNIGVNDVFVFTNELELDEVTLEIIGDGTLTFIVKDDVVITESKFNYKEPQSKVRIISTGGKEVKIEDSIVYAQIISPTSKVEIEESKVYGSVIAKNMHIKDDVLITYKEFNFNDSGLESENSGSGDGLEYIITSEPAIEVDE